MIDPDMRNAIYQLHLQGIPLRKISSQFKISRNTVRSIIAQQGQMPNTVRKDKIHIDPELLGRLVSRVPGLDPAGARKAGRGRRISRSAIRR